MVQYKNKWRDIIHEDLRKEFKKVEKKNGLGFRDDQEVFKAWQNIIDKYLKEITWDRSSVYWRWSLEPLKNCKQELINKYNKCEWWKLLTSNEVLLNNISSDIDNAENEVLNRLLVNKDLNELKQLENKSKEVYWKEIFTVSNDRNIIFDKESNDKILLDVVKKVFPNKEQSFMIDYSNCKNNKIKEEVRKLTWSEKYWITYNSQLNQFQIISKDKKIIKSSPKIREWVKLTTEKSVAVSEKFKELNDSDITYDEKLEEFPDSLRNVIEKRYWKQWLKKVIEETDKRLDQILQNAIKHNYDLHIESVTESMFVWIAEIHFINKNAEEDIVLRKDAKVLWSQITQILISKKNEYIEYIKKRVSEKWYKLKENSHKHKIDLVERDSKKALNEKEKHQMLKGIELLKTFIHNQRNTVWNAKISNRDKWLLDISTTLESVEFSLNSDLKISKEKIRKNVLESISLSRTNFRLWWFNTLKTKNSIKEESYKVFESILFWKIEDVQLVSLRKLSDQEALFDKTESSFLDKRILKNGSLELNNEKMNECFHKLRNSLNISESELNFDSNWKLIKTEKIKLIDKLYEISENDDWTKVAKYLCDKWFVPKEYINNPLFIEWCRKIPQGKWWEMSIMRFIGWEDVAINKLCQGNSQEIHELRMKTNKTDEELQRLQALEFLSENKEFVKNTYQILLNSIIVQEYYCEIWDNAIYWLKEFFLEKWWWAKGEMWKVINDIVWVGTFDLSDKNAKRLWIVLKEIIILLAVWYLASWAITRAALKWLTEVKYFLKAKQLMNAEKIDRIIKLMEKTVEISDKFLAGKWATAKDRINRLGIKWVRVNTIDVPVVGRLKKSVARVSEWKRIRSSISWPEVTWKKIIEDWMDLISSGI